MQYLRQRCDGEYDYVVVGSGAGGGPLAARLAREGYSVALLEAGGEETTADYEVPAFFTRACEDPAFGWDYFVRHYDAAAQQKRDDKYQRHEYPRAGARARGVWYPRAGTLGGCTAHHALITVRPHDRDWDEIAELTGDNSWRACRMQGYFERMERCGYAAPPLFGEPDPAGHGFRGWLSTHVPPIRLLLRDRRLLRIAAAGLRGANEGKWLGYLRHLGRVLCETHGVHFLTALLDPNDARHPASRREGMYFVPFSTEAGYRVSVRDVLRVARQDCPDKLTIRTNTLATRVILEPPAGGSSAPRAIGVEFMEGVRLYRADPLYTDDPRGAAATRPSPQRRWVKARCEVILAAGAFNTPQLLILSGIGPADELAKLQWRKRCSLAPQVVREGVGRNLQDRYEACVVSETTDEFAITRGATFRHPAPGEDPDPQFAEWLEGKGPYTTNGAIFCLTRRSGLTPDPDLFIFCVPGDFHGYYRGKTYEYGCTTSRLSWVILKSHTRNRKGRVTLRSADPRDPPKISFRYFDEGRYDSGSPGWEGDLGAMAEAVEFVRHLNRKIPHIVAKEIVPGPDETGAALRRFIRDKAWGHHASCSNAMGRAEDGEAVVDSRFRVIGTERLRIVDASVFPNIPGFFISAAIYMIAEKAADTIIADGSRGSARVQATSGNSTATTSRSRNGLSPRAHLCDHVRDTSSAP